ncbi:2-dehydropantoate 2-reductase [uncultured Chryseobacterium sp.]|uniref:ketopantoate reductase family protein n=1 Tax=uncultured Chryseobacterium sp. TaxID=259322 RepID=UPI0025874169|nr:2-dehydropantoate 2-reductase [uncultured Chryseobacterium sp.]
MNKKHIVVVGLGGVGGYFGFKINQTNETSGKYNVSFVARGETYKKIMENGLTLVSPEHSNSNTRPDAVVENISEIKNADLVLIGVKEYDLENVCRQLLPVISRDTVLLPMMNGVDIYDRIRTVIPDHVVLPTCVYVASHIKERGIVEHKGSPGKIIVGRDPEHFSAPVEWVKDVLSESKIEFEFKDNSLHAIWTKFIFIASFGLVTAKYNSSMGAVRTDEQQKSEAAGIMNEIQRIAAKKGIDLQDDIITATLEKSSMFPFETPTSLQLDINSGKKDNELELFAGAVLKYGIEEGVETPFTQKIYNEIKEKIRLR